MSNLEAVAGIPRTNCRLIEGARRPRLAAALASFSDLRRAAVSKIALTYNFHAYDVVIFT
jgi:hypothetical protein